MKLIEIINLNYENSSEITKQYKNAKRLFGISMKKLFGDTAEVIIGNCPHFEFTGFIRCGNSYIYWSSGDLRHRIMNSMLVRTAKGIKDFTGGSNNFVPYDINFDEHFKNKVKYLLSIQESKKL